MFKNCPMLLRQCYYLVISYRYEFRLSAYVYITQQSGFKLFASLIGHELEAGLKRSFIHYAGF